MRIKISNWLTGGSILDVEGDSVKEALEAAVKAKQVLSAADLRGADLRVADLRDAVLRAADAVIFAGYPNGWTAFGWLKDGIIQVRVGCRNFSLSDGRQYFWGKEDRREVLAALDYIEKVASLRGWVKETDNII